MFRVPKASYRWVACQEVRDENLPKILRKKTTIREMEKLLPAARTKVQTLLFAGGGKKLDESEGLSLYSFGEWMVPILSDSESDNEEFSEQESS